MKAIRGFGYGHAVIAVLAISMLAVGLSYQRVAAQSAGVGKPGKAVASKGGGTSILKSVRLGPGIPKFVPVLPPEIVDYRKDSTTELLATGLVPINIGARRSPKAGAGRVASGITGTSCRFDPECNDCNPCTLDECASAVCNAPGGRRDGFACDPDDNDCEGLCDGGLADGERCVGDVGCCGDVATGGVIENGTCLLFPCDLLTKSGDDFCVNAVIPAGQFEQDSECDDGLQCNGQETCDCSGGTCAVGQVGLCVPGEPLGTGGVSCEDQELVCDEDANSCIARCLTDGECNQDELECSNDRCDVRLCVAGGQDGQPCRTDEDCQVPGEDPGTCSGGGTGECFVDVGPCGPGGGCTEATPGPPPTELFCDEGRCCDPNTGECNELTFQDCTDQEGIFLATDDPCMPIGESNVDNVCPVYGGGIAPQGTFVVEVGPATGFGSCPGSINRVGDDYATASRGPGGFISLELVRFVASGQVASRTRVEFWDISVDPPIFIEDVITNGVISGVASVRTLVFDPPLIVPDSGVMALSNANEFTPLGAISWLSVEVGDVNVGTNDPNKMFVDGEVVSGFLGKCSDGSRVGLWCDTNGVAALCPGGICENVDDVLAFEIVGFGSGSPAGACCDTADGACVPKLPWICREDGGVFQGAGTLCAACSNDLFAACTVDLECPACDGNSDNEGDACSGDEDCPGGACSETATCVQLPPACSIQACCNESNGDCISQAGLCAIPPPPLFIPIPCGQDKDCGANGPCQNNECPAETVTQGFGSTCEPNCCDQPLPRSGGDNCFDAPVVNIQVPDLGDDPVAVTKTGNNSTATFDDWNEGVCDGGTNPGQSCDPDVGICDDASACSVAADDCADESQCQADDEGQCGAGGGCDRLCGSGIFNPDGGVQDPGWWEAFHIDDCADVRIDLCCTDINGLVLQPQWAFVSTGCPCETFIANEGVDPPIGEGVGTEGFARGAPFCQEDNLWQTFLALPPGSYYFPILSDPDGTCAAPIVDGSGCDYQLHFTVGACKIAACCGAVCQGGDLPGRPCNPDGIAECPDGECVGGVCVDGILQGFACDETGVDQCPGGGVCDGTLGCDVVDQLVCEAARGFWMAKPNTPEAACNTGDNFGMECADDDDCLLGGPGSCVIVGNVVVCDIGGVSPCDEGVCCSGPGECLDRSDTDNFPPGVPMTAELCDTTTEGEGTFLGGSRCEFPQPPCPVCTVEREANCHEENTVWYYTADLINGGGRGIADDFIADGNAIEQLCWWSAYAGPGFSLGRCDQIPEPAWEIRFYADSNGLPGAEIQDPQLGPIEPSAMIQLDDINFQWSLVFDPPIPVELGQRYWVAWVNSGATNDSCRSWARVHDGGNQWALWEFDTFDETGGEGEGTGWTLEDHNVFQQDFAFCIDTGGGAGFTEPPEQTGACCECDGTCTDNVRWQDCLGASADTVGGTNVPSRGRFAADETCAEITCEVLGAGGACPGEPSGVEGEDCDNAKLIVEGKHSFSNRCSTTDGRGSYPVCDVGSNVPVAGDVWFEHHAPAEGRVDIDLCGDINFDPALAVSTNGTDICPDCPPPLDDLVGGQCVADAAGLCPQTGPSFQTFAAEGQCFLIRISTCLHEDCGEDGTVAGTGGEGEIEIRHELTSCFPSATPEPERIPDQNGFPVELTKNRYLSVSAGDPGKEQAIRVIPKDMPGEFAFLDGTGWWVGPPVDVSENGSSPVPIQAFPNFKAATLQCEPFFMDWNGACLDAACDGGLRDGTCIEGICAGGQNDGGTCTDDSDCPGDQCTQNSDCRGVVHVFHENIIPEGTYTIQVLEEMCNPGAPESFSDPLIVTMAKWGDTVEACAVTPCTPPEGVVNIIDVLGILGRFISDPESPTKARTDLEPSVPDRIINISDVLFALAGFQGQGFPFSIKCDEGTGKCQGGLNNLEDCTEDADCRAVCPGGAVRGVALGLGR